MNGTAVFMYSEKYRSIPLTLEVIPKSDWHITTGLKSVNNSQNTFSAKDYDELADCPLEIGMQKDISFELDGKKYVVSIFGETIIDSGLIINDFKKIIEANINFWRYIPYEKYVFIIHCTPQSEGGTEHVNSTIVGVRPDAFDTSSPNHVKAYNNFLNLISHEYFHTWNVKQLKPSVLTRIDYSKENYTEELWIAEGSTSYYDGLIILRTGLYSLELFFEEITNAVREERRRPGNKIQTLAQSSFDAWIKFWRHNPNSFNAETDYYAKGYWVSLLLDLYIRQITSNKFSLDDVFRTMLVKYPLGTGYNNSDFIKTCEEISKHNLTEFFDDYLYGTLPLDWEKCLGYAGLELIADDSIMTPDVGLLIEQSIDKILISGVITGSSSEKAGVLAGDEILAIDSMCLSYSEMEAKVKSIQTGQKFKLTIVRDNKIRDFTLMLEDITIPHYKLRKVSNPTELRIKIYESWLNHKWEE